jgi:DegV family protein with EDD domain
MAYGRGMAKVAVVTDSTAMLPEAEGIFVVPSQIVIDETAYDDGTPESSPEAVLAALRERRTVSTSRPTPAALGETYEALAAKGYDEIVSVHLSAEMSGTFESAQVAGRSAPVPVVAVDTRAVGPCLGFAVLAAADAVNGGAGAQEAAEAAKARAEATESLFYVDSLEYLRRGGRIGAARAVLGSALAVKPLLGVDDGRVVLRERVRTAARALSRLEELALEAAGDREIEVAVAHLGASERAEELTEHLRERLAGGLAGRDVRCWQLGAVLAAHVGPGTLAVVVAPAL